MSEERDPLERIGELVGRAWLPDPTPLATIAARARRRRRRRTAGIAALATVVALSVGAVFAASGADDGRMITTADGPRPTAAAPPLGNERTRWEQWMVDGVVDRQGERAPVYRRGGTVDGLVVVLGQSIPCLDERTCRSERPDIPEPLGFLAEPGPLADWPAVYVPSWNDDFHLGRRGPAALPGLEVDAHFLGAENVEAVLAEVGAAPDAVVLAGLGGGGLGALHHLPTVAETFEGARLQVLVDSLLVPVTGGVLAPCLVELWSDAWGVAPSPGFPGSGAAADPAAPLSPIYEELADAVPGAQTTFALFRSDPELRRFFGLGRQDCALEPDPIPAEEYGAALDAAVSHTSGLANWEIVEVSGNGHGVLARPDEDPLTAHVHTALTELLEPQS